MSYLVDTSVLIARGLAQTDDWSISAVTAGELRTGVLTAQGGGTRAQRLGLLEAVLECVSVVPVDGPVASAYAEIRALTGREPSNDLWIAATARAKDLRLVTADRAMARLPGVITHLVA